MNGFPALAARDGGDKFRAVPTDGTAEFRILVGDALGFAPQKRHGIVSAWLRPQVGESFQLTLHSPGKIARRGARGCQRGCTLFHPGNKRAIFRRAHGGEPHAVPCRRADKPRAADNHGRYGMTDFCRRTQPGYAEFVGENSLINDKHPVLSIPPDGSIMLSVHQHGIT